MSIWEKHIIRYYTIVEVMVAMSIFLVMMTIMMQFFGSAQKVWNLSSKKNEMYANARVAMNIMTREVQSMLYANDGNDLPNSKYPFWFECTTTDVNVTMAPNIKTHFKDTDELSEDSSGTPYLTALNFIATTDIKSIDKTPNICEIRYRFIPLYLNGSKLEGGYLQRKCTEEYYDASGTDTITPSGATDDYNFEANLYNPPANRVNIIWTPPSPSKFDFRTVIRGVYSLKFTCYVWNGTTLVPLVPMRRSDGKDIDSGAVPGCDLSNGNPVPVAVRIDMKLLSAADLKKLGIAINDGNAKQIKNIKQTMRTFSKVIYLGKRY